MRVRALLGASAVTFALLAGCSRSADPARAAGPIPDPPVAVVPDPLPAAPPPRWASGLDAAAFAGNVAGLDRVRARMRTAAALRAPAIEAYPAALTDMADPADPAASVSSPSQAAAREVWTALGALKSEAASLSALSRSPARMRSATGVPEFSSETIAGSVATFAGSNDPSFYNHITFDGDTSWFVYDDSARGRIHWIHAFHDADGNTHNLVRDSLVYRWPYAPAAPVLMASFSHRLNYDGYELSEGLADGDGDGSLNGSAPGTDLRQRKEVTVTLRDTVWKSVWLMDHGPDDSTGEGSIAAFADSLFVKGVAVAGTRSFDGDGDRLAFSGPAGAPMVVRTESFHLDADGLRIHFDGANGPGEDGDYFAAGDNPLYPFTVAVLTAAGDTLSVHAYGDADGDGYYADPAYGAANRVWETGRYLKRDGCKSYRDSLVKTLGEPADARDDRVAYYRSDAVRLDGGEAHGSNRAPDSLGFSGAGAKTGRAGQAGTFVREETRAVEGGWERVWRKDVFSVPGVHGVHDATGPEWIWEERRYAPGGDSTVASGGMGADGSIAYADLLPGGARASGAYDPGTGRFRDTLAFNRAYEFCEGVYRAGDGTGDFTFNLRPADGAGTWTRMILAAEGGGFRVTAIHEPDRYAYSILGDTVTWKTSYGDTAAAFTAFPALPRGGGRYLVLESIADGAGRRLAEAEFAFEADRSGRGTFRGLASEPLPPPVEMLFGSDGPDTKAISWPENAILSTSSDR
jgi:hypothetical protein